MSPFVVLLLVTGLAFPQALCDSISLYLDPLLPFAGNGSLSSPFATLQDAWTSITTPYEACTLFLARGTYILPNGTFYPPCQNLTLSGDGAVLEYSNVAGIGITGTRVLAFQGVTFTGMTSSRYSSLVRYNATTQLYTYLALQPQLKYPLIIDTTSVLSFNNVTFRGVGNMNHIEIKLLNRAKLQMNNVVFVADKVISGNRPNLIWSVLGYHDSTVEGTAIRHDCAGTDPSCTIRTLHLQYDSSRFTFSNYITSSTTLGPIFYAKGIGAVLTLSNLKFTGRAHIKFVAGECYIDNLIWNGPYPVPSEVGIVDGTAITGYAVDKYGIMGILDFFTYFIIGYSEDNMPRFFVKNAIITDVIGGTPTAPSSITPIFWFDKYQSRLANITMKITNPAIPVTTPHTAIYANEKFYIEDSYVQGYRRSFQLENSMVMFPEEVDFLRHFVVRTKVELPHLPVSAGDLPAFIQTADTKFAHAIIKEVDVSRDPRTPTGIIGHLFQWIMGEIHNSSFHDLEVITGGTLLRSRWKKHQYERGLIVRGCTFSDITYNAAPAPVIFEFRETAVFVSGIEFVRVSGKGTFMKKRDTQFTKPVTSLSNIMLDTLRIVDSGSGTLVPMIDVEGTETLLDRWDVKNVVNEMGPFLDLAAGSKIQIVGSNFDHNTVFPNSIPFISIPVGVILTITTTSFTFTTGASVVSASTLSRVSVSDSVFSQNINLSPLSFGGALKLSQGGSLDLKNSMLTGNKARFGGAIAVVQRRDTGSMDGLNVEGLIKIDRCTFEGNEGTDQGSGGAMYLDVVSSNVVSLTSTVLSGNTAHRGGAIFFLDPTLSLPLATLSFASNVGHQGNDFASDLASLRVTPSSTTIRTGETLNVVVTALDAYGNVFKNDVMSSQLIRLAFVGPTRSVLGELEQVMTEGRAIFGPLTVYAEAGDVQIRAVALAGLQQESSLSQTVKLQVLPCTPPSFTLFSTELGDVCKATTCSQGCPSTQGTCILPDFCQCNPGWEGVSCTLPQDSEDSLVITVPGTVSAETRDALQRAAARSLNVDVSRIVVLSLSSTSNKKRDDTRSVHFKFSLLASDGKTYYTSEKLAALAPQMVATLPSLYASLTNTTVPSTVSYASQEVFKDTLSITEDVEVQAITAITFIFLVVTLGFAGLIFYYRKTPAINLISPMFSLLVVLGVALLQVSVLLMGWTMSKEGCGAQIWSVVTGVTLVVTNLNLKSWRVFKIFDAAANGFMLKSDLTNKNLLMYSALLTLVNWIIIFTWLIVDHPVPTLMDGSPKYWTCASENSQTQKIFLAVLFIYNLGQVVYGGWIAYKTRNINSAYRESKQLSLTFFTIFLSALASLPVLTTNQPLSTQYVTFSILLLLNSVIVLITLFGPRLYIVLFAKNLNDAKVLAQQSVREQQVTRATKIMEDSEQVGSMGNKSKRTTKGMTPGQSKLSSELQSHGEKSHGSAMSGVINSTKTKSRKCKICSDDYESLLFPAMVSINDGNALKTRKPTSTNLIIFADAEFYYFGSELKPLGPLIPFSQTAEIELQKSNEKGMTIVTQTQGTMKIVFQKAGDRDVVKRLLEGHEEADGTDFMNLSG